MSKSGSHKRRSIFGLPSFTQIHPEPRTEQDPVKQHQHQQTPKTLRKRKVPTLVTNLEAPAEVDLTHDDALSPARSHPSPGPATSQPRPTLSARAAARDRPTSSVFGSLRSFRSNYEDDALLTTTSSGRPPSLNWADTDTMGSRPKLVLHHGEVQTSSSMFRKKKEYLALTESHILRYKSQGKASESLSGIPSPFGRSPQIRHASTNSIGSSQDLQSLHSDSSGGDKEGRVPLRQVVAVHKLDDGRPYFAIEVCYLDEESTQASALTMQFADPDDRNLWLRSIRQAANNSRLREASPVLSHNSRNVARAVERAQDYDPSNFAVYKIIQRSSVKSGRSSTDDLAKIASTVCFLAVGIHKVHIIPLAKATSRTSSPSLVPPVTSGSYGILTLTHVRVHASDDSFELTFRQPLSRPKTLYLASLASQDIAIRLHHAENILRPDCDRRLFKFSVPAEVEDQLPPPVDPEAEEHCCFERTLTAYCIAYDVNPSNICYTIDYSSEDAPLLQLLAPNDQRRSQYSAEELLAVMRALRYNETFGSLSFSGVRLDILNGTHDTYGSEHVCSRTKRGAPIRLTTEELNRSCLLVQEIRALAATNKKLRRMDFSGCITTKPPEYTDDLEYRPKDIGCGIVEALFPLCKHQTTNVDWIALNGIHLSETDLDYLVGAAVDKACHFRALELSRCSLTDRTLGLIMDSLRAQENTLEALDISGNLARLSPAAFDSQISVFGVIRKLNLSYIGRTSGSEPLLTSETLLTWRLEELRLTGTALNEGTVQALSTYLRHPQSNTLRELYLDHCYLSGRDLAVLMQAMARDADEPRHLHLDISHNNTTKEYDQLSKAIASDYAPTHVTLRAVEYREESVFRHLIHALRMNRSIRCLDISRTSLPNEVGEDTSQALERFFAENQGLEDLDISGEDSRLEISRFGAGLNRALIGLRHNRSLHVLRVQFQRLGLPGATILARVLRENSVLRELHCEHNDIPLPALTDMINSLCNNTTLVYLPTMNEGRAAALKHTELSVKSIRDEVPMPPAKSFAPPASKAPSSFGMSKGFAKVKKTVNRTASAYTPSFPSLPTSHKASTPTPDSGQHRQVSSSLKTKLGPASPVSGPTTISNLSDQDIQAALRLVSESWDRQQYRLQQYLQRNLCILQGIPTAMQIEEEDFERPESIGSLSKMLEKVKMDSTPTAEKELDFSRGSLSTADGGSSITTPEPPQLELSHLEDQTPDLFDQFLLDGSGESSPGEDGTPDEGTVLEIGLAKGRHAHGLGLDFQGAEQKTPTQAGFFE